MGLKYYIYATINKIFVKMNLSHIYINKYGVKSYNQIMKSQNQYVLEKKTLKPDELYLGLDGLKDKYTLVDTRIDSSPHFELMKVISEKGNLKECSYCKRYEMGFLDTRNYLKVNKNTLEFFQKKYLENKEKIELSEYEPVQVYFINNKYYIADGKHRAALCAYLKKNIECYIISNDYLKDSFRGWIIELMKKNNKFFKKHNKIIEFTKGENNDEK